MSSKPLGTSYGERMSNLPEEYILKYPSTWEDEYRKSGFVQKWRDEYPALFEDYKGSTRLETLDLFPQYALMFLLRRDQGIRSITWYKLASTPEKSKNKAITLKHWEIMRHWMGRDNFEHLRTKLRENGFKDFTGEPDLFCWEPGTGTWFFAEAKGKDRLSVSQLKWFTTCREALGELADIHVYRLVPERT
jgi:hypothetical protein